jgi:hypothetical protein
MCVEINPPVLSSSPLPPGLAVRPLTGFPRVVDEGMLRACLAALEAVINCEPFADVAPPGTEGFLVYEEVAAARERLADLLGEGTA